MCDKYVRSYGRPSENSSLGLARDKQERKQRSSHASERKQKAKARVREDERGGEKEEGRVQTRRARRTREKHCRPLPPKVRPVGEPSRPV